MEVKGRSQLTAAASFAAATLLSAVHSGGLAHVHGGGLAHMHGAVVRDSGSAKAVC